jgi:predicted Rossmann fold flavoprotein
VEGTEEGGKKILISGGGRCNILPAEAAPEKFVTDSSANSLKKILRSWPLAEQVAFFEEELDMRLLLEEDSQKLFPETDRARDVRDRMLARVSEAGVRVLFGTRLTALKAIEEQTKWLMEFDTVEPIEAPTVILATGGLSVPATGSDGKGLSILRRIGLAINATYPALTPLTRKPAFHSHLSGVSLEVTIRAPGARPRFATKGGFLFTHRGYSGPAVLDASHLAVKKGDSPQPLTVQWTPLERGDWEERLKASKQTIGAALSGQMPRRLAMQLITEAGLEADQQLAQLQRPARQALLSLLCEYPLEWTGDEGYKKAEVTGGGVALSEINPLTMESKKHPGLFICGELLDAFGPIGGHNFMWAWTTGRAAGMGAAATVR